MSEEKEPIKEETIDTIKMNIFIKLQHVRAELQERNLTKSARNEFSKYDYFELSDFLPSINELCLKYHLFTYCDINSDLARITAVDCDNPEIVFVLTMDSAEIELKGMNKIQGIGSQNTYMRRYLYMALFEISESDALDAITGKEEKLTKGKKQTTATSDVAEKDRKTIAKEMASALAMTGKQPEVNKILLDIGKVKNINNITDTAIIEEIIAEFKKI